MNLVMVRLMLVLTTLTDSSRQTLSLLYRNPRLSTNVRMFEVVRYRSVSSVISVQPVTKLRRILVEVSISSVMAPVISSALFSRTEPRIPTKLTMEPPKRSSDEATRLSFIVEEIFEVEKVGSEI